MRSTEMNEKVSDTLTSGAMTASEIAGHLGFVDQRAKATLKKHLDWMTQNGLVFESYACGERVYSLS